MFKPQTGFAIIRLVEPGKTKGGLVIPGTAREHYECILVEASEGHWVGAGFVECKALPGARVVVTPDVKMFNNTGLPDEKHMIVRLMDVAAYEVIGAEA